MRVGGERARACVRPLDDHLCVDEHVPAEANERHNARRAEVRARRFERGNNAIRSCQTLCSAFCSSLVTHPMKTARPMNSSAPATTARVEAKNMEAKRCAGRVRELWRR